MSTPNLACTSSLHLYSVTKLIQLCSITCGHVFCESCLQSDREDALVGKTGLPFAEPRTYCALCNAEIQDVPIPQVALGDRARVVAREHGKRVRMKQSPFLWSAQDFKLYQKKLNEQCEEILKARKAKRNA